MKEKKKFSSPCQAATLSLCRVQLVYGSGYLSQRQFSGEGWSQSRDCPHRHSWDFFSCHRVATMLTELAWGKLPPRWHLRVLRRPLHSTLGAVKGSNILKLHLCDLGFWVRMSNDTHCMIAGSSVPVNDSGFYVFVLLLKTYLSFL